MSEIKYFIGHNNAEPRKNYCLSSLTITKNSHFLKISNTLDIKQLKWFLRRYITCVKIFIL